MFVLTVKSECKGNEIMRSGARPLTITPHSVPPVSQTKAGKMKMNKKNDEE